MIESETDVAWEDSKVSLTEAEKKQKNKERMAEIRAKRKPPKLANVHPSVLELPDDHPFSYKNVKQWIETQKGISSSAGIVEKSPYIFRNALTRKIQARYLAEYSVNKLKLKRFAILYPLEPFGEELKDEFSKIILLFN